MSHNVQRQSPVLAQVVDMTETHMASLPLHACRKLSRLTIQVQLCHILHLKLARIPE